MIVEGLNPEDEEGIDELLQEGKNGGNKYAYWVARSTTAQPSEWIKLPNFTSDQIIKARLFKRFLSGDLETEIPSYPLFPGLEKNLLRVQIARIVGMYKNNNCLIWYMLLLFLFLLFLLILSLLSIL